MKNDFGIEWKREDYYTASLCIIGILILIITPALMYGSLLYFVGTHTTLNFSKFSFYSTITIIVLWFFGMSYWTIRNNGKKVKYENSI